MRTSHTAASGLVVAFFSTVLASAALAQTASTPMPASPQNVPGAPAPGASSMSPAAGVNPTPKPANSPNDRICETVVPTGTHFAQKECHTRAEWAQMSDDARDSINGVRNSSGGPH